MATNPTLLRCQKDSLPSRNPILRVGGHLECGGHGAVFSPQCIFYEYSVEYHFNLEPRFCIRLLPPICLRMVNGDMIFEKSLFTWQGSRWGSKTLGYYHGNVDRLFWFCLSVASSRVSTSAIFHGWVRSLPSWTKRLSLPLPWLQRGNLWFGSWFFHTVYSCALC